MDFNSFFLGFLAGFAVIPILVIALAIYFKIKFSKFMSKIFERRY